MLTTFSIRNYALIEELSIELGRGLNILTGETGAGKSIIIDALSLILGERAEIDAVRKGAEKAVVEGVFAVKGNSRLKLLLQEHEIEWSNDMIVRREVSVKGSSRSFVNDTPVTTALLKQVGDVLVDLHGQHEHQSLLRADTHIDLLDGFGGLENIVNEFADAYRRASETLHQLDTLNSKEAQLMERRTLYEFQIHEIDELKPEVDEETRLESELTILENSERLFSATERLSQMLYEGDNAVHDQLIVARNELERLASIDRAFEEPRAEAASAAIVLSELAKFIKSYNANIEFNPERLEEIRNRLGALTLLKKKYGGSLEAVIRHRAMIGREFELANNVQKERALLEHRLEEERTSASKIARQLSSKRLEAAAKMNKAIVQVLGTLGIPKARFETRISNRPAQRDDRAIVRLGKDSYEASSRGIDQVEFYISTNQGEDAKPLVKIASGGEVSRIMLALKMILAASDRLPLLIFDEIDSGVSGRIAQAVGQGMKKLSQFHQLVAITHLPQIAGMADTHFVVEKIAHASRSFTRVRKLDVEERVGEVARLMSGIEVTERGLETARELMGLQ